MKLLVLSICHNEAGTIGELLDGIPEKIDGITQIEKWVIDDGSTDGTSEVAAKHGASVVSDGAQKRLAFRFREAVDLALAQKADIMVNIDGDLQFNPADIPKLVAPIADGQADFAAADRFSSPETGRYRQPANMPKGKYLGNRMGARVVSYLSRHEFHDVTCGFRAYNRKALFALNTDGAHTYTQESFQVLAMKRLRIASVPVDVKYFHERKSRVVGNILHYVAVSAVNILRSFRDFAPLRFFGWLGFIPVLLGLIALIIFFGHYFLRHQFSPFKFLGFAGVYLVTIGVIFWALGLVADMLSRMLNNQEKILERVKRLEASAGIYADSENNLKDK
ncbi:MAG TPA: glycosyltransferase family 2 protein [Candidatus Saccharimonadales bacterium]|nr:glycosyltransferase family 2 protein [Candidatus Saccharimonadales bacterium]